MDETVKKKIEECKLKSLRSLELPNKGLKIFNEEILSLKHVQFLYLEGNALEMLPEKFAPSFPLLRWLDLRHNYISSLPRNLYLLKNLRNLLLEGNNLMQLPLELGLLSCLSGLSLAGNPLEMPSKDVISFGTKAILKYLKELLAVEQKFGNLELEDSDTEEVVIDKDYTEYDKDATIQQNNSDAIVQRIPAFAFERHRYRRCSLEEEEISNDPPYCIQKLSIQDSLARQRQQQGGGVWRKSNSNSAPPHRPSPKGHKKSYFKDHQTHSEYLRRGTIDSGHLRDVEQAERKAFNERVDSILQKKKDNTSLDDWRKKTRRIQIHSHRTKAKNHGTDVKTPYGNDLQQCQEKISKHAKGVKEVLSKDKVARSRELRDQELEERIQDHAKHIREWREQNKLDKRENDLQAAKQNLEKALNLQRDLEEKRALQYRLRAFTAEDFSPRLHAKHGHRTDDC